MALSANSHGDVDISQAKILEHLLTNTTSTGLQCVDGIMLSVWNPLENVTNGQVALRGIIYLVSLIYLFVGVSVLADRFMASIEMITSKEKELHVRNEKGVSQVVVVRVWNETVANLTLMALGCSAPEILLSSIEIIGKKFEAGELGPGSTVGSAVFNLFVIIGVCNYSIPEGQVRRVKRVSVFIVTAAWSIFAYLWLYIILSVSSYGVIEVWEAVITFLFFPITVISAYIADRNFVIYDYFSKRYRMGRNGVIVEMTTDEAEVAEFDRRSIDRHLKKFAEENENEEVREFENHRRAFIVLIKNLRRKYPTLNSNQLELMATKELLDRGTKSRAFYRILASKKLTGRGVDKAKLDFTQLFSDFNPIPVSPRLANDRHFTKVYFSPGHYTVMENVGQFCITVVREEGDLSQAIQVDYSSEDGEAIEGKDYEPIQGTITFEAGETSKSINVTIINDDIYEEDQHFYIRLFNPRLKDYYEYDGEKGDISEDAYTTKSTVYNKPAPSYSVIEIEDSPPRYSVTAREILNALKANKQLRRPSVFLNEAFDNGSEFSDDVFFDAISHVEDEQYTVEEVVEDLDTIVLENQSRCSYPISTIMTTPQTRKTSVASSTSSSESEPKNRSKFRVRNSVSFSSEIFAANNRSSVPAIQSSDSDDGDFECTCHMKNSRVQRKRNKQVTRQAFLRLVCPSLATVMILDDDHHGIFSLTERNVCLTETVGTYNMKIIRCGGSRGRVVLPYRTEEGTAHPKKDYQHCEGEVMFEDGETEKTVAVFILVKSSYEKDVLFYFSLGEPRKMKEDGDSDSIVDIQDLTVRAYSQLTEQQRTAMKGRPQLGEITTTQIRLKESKEFKNSVDKILKKANATFKYGKSSWKQQFIDAIHLENEESSDVEQTEHGIETLQPPRKPTSKDYAMHCLTVFWRVVFAFIPPEGLGGGYPCFVFSVVAIGIMTSLIGDVASHLGCTVGLKDSVTALAFVSLGTSLPDLFASRVSAVQDQHADASISNVTGSNAVNVFLGIGVAWLMASVHHAYNGTVFYVEPGSLAFSVTLYCCMAVIAIIILLLRRREEIGGELGGPMRYRIPTTVLFVCCWIMYIFLASFEAYGYINGF